MTEENEKETPPCYYELLGVEKDATQDQIRKAYLRASLKFHPDKNPGDEAAEEMFKLISEAYSVLQDETKRELYDKYGHEAAKSNIDPEELFEQMFGTRDPKEAFKKVMSDPELRGPVISGVGLATTVGSVYAIYNGIKNKKGMSAVGHAAGGLVGTAAGLTVTLGGLATWGVDAAITASKKGINNISTAIDDKVKESKSKKSLANSPNESSTSTKANDQTSPKDNSSSPSDKTQPKSSDKQSDFMKFFTNFSNSMGSPTSTPKEPSATPMPPPSSSSSQNTASNNGPIPMPMPKNQENLGHPFGNGGNSNSDTNQSGSSQAFSNIEENYKNIYPSL